MAMCVVVVVAAAAVGVEGIMFHLQPNSQKCFKEEIHKNVLVSGEYEVQEAPGQKVDIQVSSCQSDSCLQVTHTKGLLVVPGPENTVLLWSLYTPH